MASIQCYHGGFAHIHTSVAEVRECQGVVATAVDAQAGRLTDEHPGTESRGADRHEEQWADNVQRHGSTAVITKPIPPGELAVQEEGFYHRNGTYFKVVESGSGRLYAKALDEQGGKWVWVYAKGAMRDLRAKHKMQPEDYKAFGQLTGNCAYCMQKLTRQESMDRGYGPICADNRGLPYDHSAP